MPSKQGLLLTQHWKGLRMEKTDKEIIDQIVKEDQEWLQSLYNKVGK
jgi:hypothetical protein